MKARLELGAELDFLSPSEFHQGIDKVSLLWRQYAEGLKHVRFPTMQTVSTGTVTLGSSDTADQPWVGPNQGYAWRVNRVSIYGMSTGESLDLYLGDVGPSRFVTTITAAQPAWDTSRGLLLHPGDHLVVTGTAASGEQITVSGEAIEAPAEQIFKLVGA